MHFNHIDHWLVRYYFRFLYRISIEVKLFVFISSHCFWFLLNLINFIIIILFCHFSSAFATYIILIQLCWIRHNVVHRNVQRFAHISMFHIHIENIIDLTSNFNRMNNYNAIGFILEFSIRKKFNGS